MSIEKLQKGYILPGMIVVKEVPKTEKVTSTGIVLPNVKKREPQSEGDVVLVGEGTAKDPMKVQIGMRVLFPPMSGQMFYLDDLGDEIFQLIPQSKVIWMWFPESK